MDSKKAAMLAAVCGGVVLIGVLMPWYSFSFDFGDVGVRIGVGGGTTRSLNGTEGDFHGGFVLVLGVLGGIAGALLFRGTTAGLPLTPRGIGLVAVAAFGLGALVTLTDVFRDVPSISTMHASAGRGFGMYLTLLACLAGAGVSFLCLRGLPKAAPPS